MAAANQIVISILANGQSFIATLQGLAKQTQQWAQQTTNSVKGAVGAFDTAGKSVQSFSSKLANLGKEALGNIARFTSYYLSVGALTRVLGGAISEARDFDEALRNIQSITLETDDRIKTLGSDLLKLTFTGQAGKASASELAKAMYELTSAGYSSADALDLAKVAAIGASAGLTTTDSASKALLTILQAYKLPVAAAGEVMNQLFTIVDKGVLHFDDLVTNLGYVIPAAAALKVPINELGAAIELLTRQGQQPSRVMTNLNDVMTRLLKPNAELSAVIKNLGFSSGTAMVKTLGFVRSIALIEKASREMDDPSGKAAKKIEDFGTKSRDASQKIDDFNETVRATAADVKIAERELAATAPGSLKWQKAREKLTKAQAAHNKALRESRDAVSGAAHAARDYNKALDDTGNAAEDSESALAKWFGDVRAIRAILPLAANNGRDFTDMFREHNEEAKAGDRHIRAWNEQQKSFNAQLAIFGTRLKGLTTIGIMFLGKFILPVLKYLNKLLGSIVIVDKATGNLYFIWEMYPKILEIVTTLFQTLALILAIKLLPPMLKMIPTAFTLAKALLGLIGPWALIAVAIFLVLKHFGLVNVAILMVKHYTKIAVDYAKKKWAEFLDFFKKGFSGGIIGGKSGFQTFAFSVGKFVAEMIPKIKKVIATIKELARLFLLGFKGGEIGGQFSKWQTMAFKAGQKIKEIFNFLWKKALPAAIDFFKDYYGALFAKLINDAKNVFNLIKGFLKSGFAKELWADFKEGAKIVAGAIAIIGATLAAFAGSDAGKFLGKLVGWLIEAGVLWYAMATAVAFLTGPVGLVVLAILGIVTAIGFVSRHWDEFTAKIRETWNGLPGIVKFALETVANVAKLAFDLLKGIIVSNVQFFIATIQNAVTFLGGVWKIISGIWKGDLGLIWEGIKQVMQAGWEQLKAFITLQLNLLKSLFGGVWSFIKSEAATAWQLLGSTITGAFHGVVGELSDIASQIYNTVRDLVGNVAEAISGLPNVIGNVATGVYNEGKKVLQSFMDGALDAIGKAIQAGGNIATRLATAIKRNVIKPAFAAIDAAIPNSISAGPVSIDIPNKPIDSVLHYSAWANGVRDWMGGLAMLGERGREMTFLPPGSTVASAPKTSQIMDNLTKRPAEGGGGPLNFEANFNVPGATLDQIESQLYDSVSLLLRQMRQGSYRRGASLNGRMQVGGI